MLALSFIRTVVAEAKNYVFVTLKQLRIRQNLIISEPSLINAFGSNVSIDGKTIIGDDCYIGANSVVADSIIGSNVKLWQNTTVEYSEIGPFVKLGAGNNCWICSSCTIHNNVTVGENVVIGANNLICKSVPSNTIIKSSASY